MVRSIFVIIRQKRSQIINSNSFWNYSFHLNYAPISHKLYYLYIIIHLLHLLHNFFIIRRVRRFICSIILCTYSINHTILSYNHVCISRYYICMDYISRYLCRLVISENKPLYRQLYNNCTYSRYNEWYINKHCALFYYDFFYK